MDPVKLVEELKQWAAVSATLLEIVPNATVADLIEYAHSASESPVAARVLAVAMSALPLVKESEVKPATTPFVRARR